MTHSYRIALSPGDGMGKDVAPDIHRQITANPKAVIWSATPKKLSVV